MGPQGVEKVPLGYSTPVHNPPAPEHDLLATSHQTLVMQAGAAATPGDELAVARCDLGLCRSFRTTVFDFARHRRPEHYRLITDRTGAVPRP